MMRMKKKNYAYLRGRLGVAFETITDHPLLVAKLDRAERAELSSYIRNNIREQDIAAEEYAAEFTKHGERRDAAGSGT
tara:strand:+ start:613 stop:846 length:234 start_codon:yes stop_codon:yes gene_type:complete